MAIISNFDRLKTCARRGTKNKKNLNFFKKLDNICQVLCATMKKRRLWLIVNILLDIEDIFYKVFKIGKRR